MSIVKADPQPTAVIVDTNVLWYTDKKYVVNPEFEKFWASYSKEFRLELFIPEVVEGELLFQQTKSAVKCLGTINTNFEKISSITDKKHSTRTTSEKLKEQVNQRFQKFKHQYSSITLQTPISKIDWQNTINSSIWRIAPFEEGKEKGTEKGFRDSLVMESVIEYCSYEQSSKNIVFICNDGLLRKTTDSKLCEDSRYNSYESIEDFESYLKLTREELEQNFIRSILKKAKEKFFSKSADDCLAITSKLPQILKEEYSNYVENPTLADDAPLSFLGTSSYNSWTNLNDGRFWILDTQYSRVANRNIYHWQTPVVFAQSYKSTNEGNIAAMLLDSENEVEEFKVLILQIIVNWSSKVSKNARFSDMKIVSNEIMKKEFLFRTDEHIRNYNLLKKG